MDIQRIGIDLAHEEFGDFSSISSICSNCNYVIESKPFKGETIQATIFKKCPQCGVEFKKHIIYE